MWNGRLSPLGERVSLNGASRPLPSVVYRVLEVAVGTAEDLARETKLPTGIVHAALAELRGARPRDEDRPRSMAGALTTLLGSAGRET
jgi:hypothetical protein